MREYISHLLGGPCPTCGVQARQQCLTIKSGVRTAVMHASRPHGDVKFGLTEIRWKPMSALLVRDPDLAADVVLAFLRCV